MSYLRMIATRFGTIAVACRILLSAAAAANAPNDAAVSAARLEKAPTYRLVTTLEGLQREPILVAPKDRTPDYPAETPVHLASNSLVKVVEQRKIPFTYDSQLFTEWVHVVPIDQTGNPLKSRNGEIIQGWANAMLFVSLTARLPQSPMPAQPKSIDQLPSDAAPGFQDVRDALEGGNCVAARAKYAALRRLPSATTGPYVFRIRQELFRLGQEVASCGAAARAAAGAALFGRRPPGAGAAGSVDAQQLVREGMAAIDDGRCDIATAKIEVLANLTAANRQLANDLQLNAQMKGLNAKFGERCQPN